MSETYVGSETLPADGYLQPRRVKITCLCHRCGHEFSWVAKAVTAKDRPCPRKACKEAAIEEDVQRRAANMAKIFEEQRAPGVIGDKMVVKAVDETARIVMEDHNMTDLKDNIRPGEAMAPKLPGAQQAAADNYFSANPLQSRGVGSRQAELLKRRALAGAFRGMAINPSNVVPGTPGQSPMRHIRTEKL